MDVNLALWAIEQNRHADATLAQRRAAARAAGSKRAGRSGVRRVAGVLTLAIAGARDRRETLRAGQGGRDVRGSF